jgi:hypothetical protein
LEHQAEMATAPGHRFAIGDQSGGYSGYRLLSRAGGAVHVEIDAQR